MELQDNNGLAKVIHKIIGKNKVYYKKENFEIVIYYLDANQKQLQNLKLIVLDYINKNMLHRVYEKITIYT